MPTEMSIIIFINYLLVFPLVLSLVGVKYTGRVPCIFLPWAPSVPRIALWQSLSVLPEASPQNKYFYFCLFLFTLPIT